MADTTIVAHRMTWRGAGAVRHVLALAVLRTYFRGMLRHGLSRFLAAIFMVWFAIFMGEPSQLHLCPLHDGTASHASHATMPGHDLPGHAGHHCTCAGTCCSANSVAVPRVATSIGPAVEIADQLLSLARESRAVTAPRHLHPPSLGPPALRFV